MAQTRETIDLNQAAELLPMVPHPDDEPGHPVSRPAIRVADVLVFAYVEHDDATGALRLVVSVDLDDVTWSDGPVPMRVNVGDDEIARFDSDGRAQYGPVGRGAR